MNETNKCGAHFDRHPDRPHLVAVCTRPAGHPGDHCQILHKPFTTCGICARLSERNATSVSEGSEQR